MQPMPEIAQYYLLIDDINWSIIKHHHCNPDKTWKKGRLVIETSPGNYQVWIHSSNVMSIDNKRFLRCKYSNVIFKISYEIL